MLVKLGGSSFISKNAGWSLQVLFQVEEEEEEEVVDPLLPPEVEPEVPSPGRRLTD